MSYDKYYQNIPQMESRRRKLRRDMTWAEKLFWIQVKNKALGYKFRRQFSIERFIVDFYCHRLKLIVEIDGFSHENEQQKSYDAWRQKKLEGLGCIVIRYTDAKVLNDTESVKYHLLRVIQSLGYSDPLRITPPVLP